MSVHESTQFHLSQNYTLALPVCPFASTDVTRQSARLEQPKMDLAYFHSSDNLSLIRKATHRKALPL